MGKKQMKYSTRWFVGNDDDAQQILEWFHGDTVGDYREEHLARIRNAVIGTPKKGIVAMLGWCLEQRALQTPEDPFIASVALDEWASSRGFGKYADLEDEELVEV